MSDPVAGPGQIKGYHVHVYYSPQTRTVAERSGRVLGYCYAGPYRTRSAYRFTVEDSIYIDGAEVGCGLGRALLATLLDRCGELGYRQMVAVIGGSETWPSIRLHAALGFTRVGVLPAVGFKFGSWVDIVLMRRALGPGATTAPEEISSIKWEGRS